MKKYGALLIVLVVIAATLGTHYIQLASASSKNAVTFETLSGDERYINELIIEGSVDSEAYYSSVRIQNGETKHLKGSIFDRRLNLTNERLIDAHKGFMRGKLLDASHYYEDEERLIYVKEPDDIWKLAPGDDLPYAIEILNKSDNSVTAFTVNNKLIQPVKWITLEHVQLVGNELKLVSNYVKAIGNEEAHLLIIDLKSKQLKNDIVIETIQSNDKINKYLGFYFEYYHLGPEKYFVYHVSEYEARSEQVTPLSQQFKALDIATNEVTEIEIPEQIFGDEYRIVVLGHQLIAATIIDGEVVVNRYNIGQQQWLAPITLESPSKVLERATFKLQTLNDKLYVLAQLAEGQLLTIVDAESGESLYTGLIKPTTDQPDFTLSVSRFYENEE